MERYVNEILTECEVTGHAATPALIHLYEVRDSPALSSTATEQFHSRVAKLLYLTKRIRPDMLAANSFLASRVHAPTEDDWNKLDRLLRYLNSTKSMGIALSADHDLSVLAYVDASYGVHWDAKSQTGLSISLGKGPIFAKSTKQKLVSKSSTEAELIGLSDSFSQAIWTREFLIEQGYDISPATVFQDNKSTIVMAEKGRSTSERTRHIHIRFYFIKDRIDNKELKIEYLPTKLMIADILTKPLQGELFQKLRKELLNWE